MNDFDGDVKDLVNQYYADYQYITQMASFQAQIATQHQALNAAGAMADRYGDMDPKIELYSFLDDCGAVACPYEIYAMFASLYQTERAGEPDSVKIRLRDIAEFQQDKWLLLTKSSGYRMVPHGQDGVAWPG